MKTFVRAAVALATLSAPSLAADALEANKALTLGLLEKGLFGGDTTYVTDHVAESYIQHNPMVADGRAGLLDFVGFVGTVQPKPGGTVHRVLAEGDLVVVHSEVEFFGPKAILDVFRLENGRIAEHWDTIQDVPPTSANGRTMFDGATEIDRAADTAASKALVTGFVQDVLMAGKLDMLETYLAPAYMQHNALVPDGLDGLKSFIATMAANDVTFYYTAIHNVVAEGDFVFVQSEGILNGAPTAFNDLWRVENGKLAEHWDVVQPIPTEFAHGNGMF